jgi:hypothetical protein
MHDEIITFTSSKELCVSRRNVDHFTYIRGHNVMVPLQHSGREILLRIL